MCQYLENHKFTDKEIENKMADLNTYTYLGFSIKNRIRMSEGYQRKAHLPRSLSTCRTVTGNKKSNVGDGCFMLLSTVETLLLLCPTTLSSNNKVDHVTINCHSNSSSLKYPTSPRQVL